MNIKFSVFAAAALTALPLSPASSRVINACLTRLDGGFPSH